MNQKDCEHEFECRVCSKPLDRQRITERLLMTVVIAAAITGLYWLTPC